jgi:hypothetical protein
MPKQYNQLNGSVNIAGNEFNGDYAGYAGKYSTSNSLTDETYSYYLGGDSQNMDVPHFTTGETNRGEGMFISFHITVYVGGANAGVWYNEYGQRIPKESTPVVNTNIARAKENWKNMSEEKKMLVRAQFPILDRMAAQFWTQLNA